MKDHHQFGVGGEEELLALDLAEKGWNLAYTAWPRNGRRAISSSWHLSIPRSMIALQCDS
jgi:hypothetical protein